MRKKKKRKATSYLEVIMNWVSIVLEIVLYPTLAI